MLTAAEARKLLRLSDGEFDEEIKALMDAAVADLKTAGVEEPKGGDALYNNAIRMYVRGNFWPDDEVSKRAIETYEGIKGTMKLTEMYRGAQRQ